MEDQVDRLVQKAWARFQQLPPDQRLIIGISGIPGSGKTTFSKLLTARLNHLAASSSSPPAVFLPMDGFHYTRAQLSSMPDPDTAHARRGAAFTFDAAKFLALVRALRVPLTSATGPILAPTFDHAAKDPKEDDVQILPEHRIVVLEGNYVNLDRDTWRDAAALLDESWFVKVDFEVARGRLRERHVRAGIVKTVEEGDRRALENDLPNGEEIVNNQVRVDEVIVSQPDDAWVGT